MRAQLLRNGGLVWAASLLLTLALAGCDAGAPGTRGEQASAGAARAGEPGSGGDPAAAGGYGAPGAADRSAGPAAPDRGARPDFSGRVTRWMDGDSFLMRADGRDVEVRIADIDAPEKGQPFADASRDALRELAEGSAVRVEPITTDRYGRTIGRVFVGGTDVGRFLVEQGLAWVSDRHAEDPALFAAQDRAEASGRGLWSLPDGEREPPWEWRARQPRH